MMLRSFSATLHVCIAGTSTEPARLRMSASLPLKNQYLKPYSLATVFVWGLLISIPEESIIQKPHLRLLILLLPPATQRTASNQDYHLHHQSLHRGLHLGRGVHLHA